MFRSVLVRSSHNIQSSRCQRLHASRYRHHFLASDGMSRVHSHRLLNAVSSQFNEQPKFRMCRISQGDVLTSEPDHEHHRTVGISKSEQKQLRQKNPEQPVDPRLLKVAVIGPPNAGKSTLANQLMGRRFSAVSKKVHTTRTKSVGVLTKANTQIVFLDTPGLTSSQKIKKHKMEKTLLTDPYSTLFEADLIIAVIDVSKVWNRNQLDRDVLTALTLHCDKKSILVLNKVDMVRVKLDLLTAARLLSCGRIGGKVISHFKDGEKSQAKYESILQKLDSDMQKQQGDIPSAQNDVLELESSQVNCSESDSSGENRNENARELPPPDPPSEESEINTWWKEYNKRLRKVQKETSNLKGWENFDRVFMVSALEGDGVNDIKDYLIDAAVPSPWLYHSSVLTDQDPAELARMCIWEKLLDHLPEEVPYQIKVRKSMWEVDENNTLRASFDLVCTRKRHMVRLLGSNGDVIRKISMEAKQALMNTFRQEMTLSLTAVSVPKSKPR